ncbi:hypothetical protein ES705_32112 [subsurface metagenome]
MGLPIVPAETVIEDQNISALPFRAYHLIYDHYYRDQNITESVMDELGGIGVSPTDPQQTHLTKVRVRAWEKDYFTSCLPWAQRGGGIHTQMGHPQEGAEGFTSTGTRYGTGDVKVNDGNIIGDPSEGSMYLDTHQGIDINDLRLAVRLQEWLERNARGGARYIEQILSHFGVRSSDARLQRAEYLGGGKSPVVISEVLQTAEGVEPVGQMLGHGLSVGNTNRFTKRFEEHGHVIGIVSVLPRTAYQQGIGREFQKFDKLDYYWPEFANLGEQEVLNKEVFYEGTGVTEKPDEVFGYQSRYAEYKFKQSSVHGEFRDEFDYWHLGRKFSVRQDLNSAFIRCIPSGRIFAHEDFSDKIWCQLYNNVKALRSMPKFGTPTL